MTDFAHDLTIYVPEGKEKDMIDEACTKAIFHFQGLDLIQKAFALKMLMTTFEETAKCKVFAIPNHENCIDKQKLHNAWLGFIESWSSMRPNYKDHICADNDGDDISFTKATIERFEKDVGLN